MVLSGFKSRCGRVVRLGAWLVLLTAMLPNIAYFGHWPGTPSATEHSASAEEVAAPEHRATMQHSGFAHRMHAGKWHHAPAELPDNSADTRQPDEHSLHCHTGPSSCGPHATTGSLWIGEDSGLLTFDPSLKAVQRKTLTTEPEPLAHSILQPPREVL
jgi:hypothetical protein